MKSDLRMRELGMAAALVAIFGFFGSQSPVFLSARNLSLLMIELSVTAILALGMLLVLLPGHIDLSAGSGVGLFGGAAAVLVFWHGWPAPLAIAVVMAAALLIWTLMGVLIVRERIPAFIITLGGLLVFKGVHWLIIDNQTVPVAHGGASNLYSLLTTYYVPPVPSFVIGGALATLLVALALRARRRRLRFGFHADDGELTFLKLFVASQFILLFVVVTVQYRGIPLPALILAATAAGVHVITQHTPFGRYLYAIGGNADAALVSGVRVDRTVIAAFALMGVIVAIGGLMQTAYSGASTSTVGSLMELDAIAACVIGGTSLRGGRGTVLGVLFGALIMATLLNGMTLLAVSPEVKFIARGLVLAAAVWLDLRLARRTVFA